MLSNPEADGWNFTVEGRNIKSNEEQKAYELKRIVNNETIRVNLLQNGGGTVLGEKDVELYYIYKNNFNYMVKMNEE
jgi:hypothetical protein